MSLKFHFSPARTAGAAACAVALLCTSAPLPAQPSAAGSQSPDIRGGSTTAPGNAGSVTSGGARNELNDPKGNRAGVVGGSQAAEQAPLELSSADRGLMRDLAQAHLAEIKASALATAISADPTVRSYATKMLEEHYKALDELRSLARRGGAILPGGVETGHAAMLHKLARLTGDDFNRLYLEHAGLADHQQSRELFQKASQQAQAPELKAYAGKFLPLVDQHLRLAKQMAEDPATAATAVQSSHSAGQSTSTVTTPDAASGRLDSNSAARGNSSIAGGTVGSEKR